MRRGPTVYEAMTAFLMAKGGRGASLSEIYASVRAKTGARTSDTSVRSVLYNHLITRKTPYRPTFERVKVDGESRYRIVRAGS